MTDFSDLRIALIADELTAAGLATECRVWPVTPHTARPVLRYWKPDLLLVESAWKGACWAWKYKIAAYPDHPERSNAALARVVDVAKARGIPTVFWNKEDNVHFDRFIDSAVLFDHILTVDSNCIPHYRARVAPQVTVGSMMFAVQPRLHFPTFAPPRLKRASFLGSYSHHIHPSRRDRQAMLFTAACDAGLPLDIYDRNSNRRSPNYRYPAHPGMTVHSAVPHRKTGQIYRDYLVSLNVNTVEDSPTMCSRRLVEIIACGGLAVTTPARSVTEHFAEYCHVVGSAEEAQSLLTRLHREGRSPHDEAMVRAGAEYLLAHHSWAQRLAQITGLVR